MDALELLTCLMIAWVLINRGNVTGSVSIWISTIWLFLSIVLFVLILFSNNDKFWWETQNEFGDDVIVPVLPSFLANKYKIKSSFFEVKMESSGCNFTLRNFWNELQIYPSYLFAHFTHCFFIHWSVGCNLYLTFYITSMAEVAEIYIFPYFDGDNECWYDHLFFDMLGFNLFGIIMAVLVIKLLNLNGLLYCNYNLLQTVIDILKCNYSSKDSLMNAKKTLILIIHTFVVFGWQWCCQFCLYYMGGLSVADGIVKFEAVVMNLFHHHYLQYFWQNKNKNKNKIAIYVCIICFTLNLMLRIIAMSYYIGFYNNSGWNYPLIERFFIISIIIKLMIATWCCFVIICNKTDRTKQKQK